MDDVELVAESIIKIEEENIEESNYHDSLWQSKELDAPITIKREVKVKNEDKELSTSFFLEPIKVKKEELEEQCKDPLALDCDASPVASASCEDSSTAEEVSSCSQLHLEDNSRHCRRSFTTKEAKGSAENLFSSETSSEQCLEVEPHVAIATKAPCKNKRTLSGEQLYRCDECGVAFSKSHNLTKHKRFHSGDSLYGCEECGAAFSKFHNLTTHKEIHLGERPHVCEECGVAFKDPSNLIAHKRTHSGGRPYRCEDCSAAFTKSHNLTKHKLIHSGERPYVCDECGVAFRESSNLTAHKRTHSGNRPYRCEDCSAAFSHS